MFYLANVQEVDVTDSPQAHNSKLLVFFSPIIYEFGGWGESTLSSSVTMKLYFPHSP